MTNFISLKQLADKLNKTVEQVEADVEDFGIPLYRNNGNYGLTIEDTESYINNLLSVQSKQILESIYLENSIKPTAIEAQANNTVAVPVLRLDFEIPSKAKKTDTKECLRVVLESLGDYNTLLKMLVTKEEGTQVFIENLATKLKHHKSKTIEPKVEEINKAILELWGEVKV